MVVSEIAMENTAKMKALAKLIWNSMNMIANIMDIAAEKSIIFLDAKAFILI
jgi:hypothetical protein